MTPVKQAILLLAGIVILTACSSLNVASRTSSESPTRRIHVTHQDRALWKRTVEPYLAQPLWTDRDAYDAGHVLMAPLDAAFSSANPTWLREFAEQFERFMSAERQHPSEITNVTLNRLLYLYVAARFTTLAQRTGRARLIPAGLPELIRKELDTSWLRADAWQWGRPPFHGMKERVEWKLNQPATTPSYYRGIIDEELLVMAIAGEFSAYETAAHEPSASRSSTVSDILTTAHIMLAQEVEHTSDNPFLFQVGVWRDHPDFAYAGHTHATPGMKPLPRPQVVEDSSHFSRWPLILRSLRDGTSVQSTYRSDYGRWLRDLAQQFASKVLVEPSQDFPAIRMTNYVDGWNGLFRWGYPTAGPNNGYGPYELSGTLLVGWWGLLEQKSVGAAFCKESASFPLPPEVIKTYVGPNTSRNRNPLVAWPGFFTNGFAQLEADLMCRLDQP